MAHCGTEPDSSFFITMRCLMRRHHLIHTLLLSTAPYTGLRKTSGTSKDNKPRFQIHDDHPFLILLGMSKRLHYYGGATAMICKRKREMFTKRWQSHYRCAPASKTRLWHQFPSALTASASCGTSFGLLWQPQNGGWQSRQLTELMKGVRIRE